MDTKKIEQAVTDFLIAIGEDPTRPGLIETPDRVARMCQEIFEGINYTNEEIANMFNKTFDITENKNDMVLIKDIDVFSYCEHHLALMYDMKVSVAYIPNKKVLGLSKVARIADMAAKRLQLQEKLGNDIAEIISLASDSKDVAVMIKGCHSCMSARGIKKANATTITTTYTGKFKEDINLQNKFLANLAL